LRWSPKRKWSSENKLVGEISASKKERKGEKEKEREREREREKEKDG